MHVLLNYEDLWKLRHKKDLKYSLVAIPQGPHYMQGFTLLSEFQHEYWHSKSFLITSFGIGVLTQVKKFTPTEISLRYNLHQMTWELCICVQTADSLIGGAGR